jgi:hypothetical protein
VKFPGLLGSRTVLWRLEVKFLRPTRQPALRNRRSRTSSGEFARSPRSTPPVRRSSKYLVEEEEDIALSEIGSGEDRLRRQRAHDVARTVESLHLEGSDVDPKTMAIAQRYVDGETIDELRAAIEARSTDVW